MTITPAFSTINSIWLRIATSAKSGDDQFPPLEGVLTFNLEFDCFFNLVRQILSIAHDRFVSYGGRDIHATG